MPTSAPVTRQAVHQVTRARMCRAPLGLPGRNETDDAEQGQEGAGHLPAADVLAGQGHAQWESQDEAQRSDRLDDDKRGPVQGRCLEHPARRLQGHPGQPHRAAQDLEQKAGVVPRGGHGPLLLQDGAESEEHRGEDGQRGPHGELGYAGSRCAAVLQS